MTAGAPVRTVKRGRTIRIRRFLAALITAATILAAGGQIAAGKSPASVLNATSAPQPSSVTMTNQVLVRWTPALAPAPESQRTADLESAGVTGLTFVRRTALGSDVYQLPAALGTRADAILSALRARPGVASVEPDLWLRPVDAPTNDTYADDLWGLLDPATPGSAYGIDAIDAWPTTRGSGVIVAVVDTGLLFGHPDLAGQSVAGYDMITSKHTARDGDGRDPDASDPGDWSTYADVCGASNSSWHGTHVSGTIAAVADNNKGVFGGAPDVKVQPVRVLGRCGGVLSDVADGVLWAAGEHVSGIPDNPVAGQVRAINMSLGGGGSCPSEMANAIAKARADGKVVAVAAGNSGADADGFTPANCPGAFAVAATTQVGKRAYFSNYGTPTSPVVDIAAPGTGILSTLNTGTQGPSSYTYAYYDGTSMATPHVALTAALVAAANPALTTAQIETLLKSTATSFPGSSTGFYSCNNPSHSCGAGIVNATAAVAAAAPPSPTAPGAPQNVTAAAGSSSAAVMWDAPSDDGGNDITSYTATSSPDSLTCTTAGTRSCTIGGLQVSVAYTFTVTATNLVGTGAASTSSNVVTLPGTADTDPPVAQTPTQTLDAPADLSGQVTIDVGWPAASDASGIARYHLERSVNGGSWSAVTLSAPSALSAHFPIASGDTVGLRLTARDTAGNWSDWAYSSPATSTLNQYEETARPPISYVGRFRRVALAGASGGYVKKTGAAGRTATMVFNGTDAVLVSTLGPNRGIASITVDGGPPTSVDLYAASTQPARIVWSAGGLSAAVHIIVVTVTGTANVSSSGPRIDIDAFLTL